MSEAEGKGAKHVALEMIEQAQGLLEQAAEAICPVRGLGQLGKRCCKFALK